VALDDALGRRQAEPGAAVLGGEKRLEDALANLRGNARTVIGDGNPAQSVVGADLGAHAPASTSGLRRVEEQVQEDGLQLLSVHLEDRRVS
jgi:hypothetical protein